MAIKEITQWEDPIWDKQKEESERANFYFDQFKNTDLTVEQFKFFLMDAVGQKSDKSRTFFTYKDDKYNEKNINEIKKYITSYQKNPRGRSHPGKAPAPSPRAIEEWSRKHFWLLRRQALREHLKEVTYENFESRLIENINELTDSIFENVKLMLVKQHERLAYDEKYNAYHNKADAEAINISLQSIHVMEDWVKPEIIVDENVDDGNDYIEPPDLESDEFMDRELEYLERLVDRK